MSGPPPPECQPLIPFKWIRTSSLYLHIVLFAMPWYNWNDTRTMLQRDILANEHIQIAHAKTGFWIKFLIIDRTQKLSVEIFIRVVPLN